MGIKIFTRFLEVGCEIITIALYVSVYQLRYLGKSGSKTCSQAD